MPVVGRACADGACARAACGVTAPDQSKDDSVSATKATRFILTLSPFDSSLTFNFRLLNPSFRAAREPLTARPDEKLEPLLCHQAMIRLGHMYAVETQEAFTFGRGGQ